MRIDLFNHFIPPAYLEALQRRAPSHPLVRLSVNLRPLWDMEERLRMLSPWPDLQQVVALGQPTPELIAGPDESPVLARLANDGMAAIRKAHPEKFPAFVASLPMNNVSAALEELDRAFDVLGARGVQERFVAGDENERKVIRFQQMAGVKRSCELNGIVGTERVLARQLRCRTNQRWRERHNLIIGRGIFQK